MINFIFVERHRRSGLAPGGSTSFSQAFAQLPKLDASGVGSMVPDAIASSSSPQDWSDQRHLTTDWSAQSSEHTMTQHNTDGSFARQYRNSAGVWADFIKTEPQEAIEDRPMRHPARYNCGNFYGKFRKKRSSSHLASDDNHAKKYPQDHAHPPVGREGEGGGFAHVQNNRVPVPGGVAEGGQEVLLGAVGGCDPHAHRQSVLKSTRHHTGMSAPTDACMRYPDGWDPRQMSSGQASRCHTAGRHRGMTWTSVLADSDTDSDVDVLSLASPRGMDRPHRPADRLPVWSDPLERRVPPLLVPKIERDRSAPNPSASADDQDTNTASTSHSQPHHHHQHHHQQQHHHRHPDADARNDVDDIALVNAMHEYIDMEETNLGQDADQSDDPPTDHSAVLSSLTVDPPSLVSFHPQHSPHHHHGNHPHHHGGILAASSESPVLELGISSPDGVSVEDRSAQQPPVAMAMESYPDPSVTSDLILSASSSSSVSSSEDSDVEVVRVVRNR